MAQIKTNLAYGVTGTIPTANIADDAITAAKIADNAVVTAAINADAITAAKVADDIINSEHFVDGGVDNAHLATGIASSKLSGALPAVSGASLTSLNASNLGSGTVPTARLGSGTANNTVHLRGDGAWAAAGGGKVLQIQHSTDNTHISQGSASEYSEITTAITPAATSSKIIVMVTLGFVSGSTTLDLGWVVKRDTTDLQLGQSGSGAYSNCTFGGSMNMATGVAVSSTGILVDSPSSTSAISYKVFLMPNSNSMVINKRGSNTATVTSSTMTLIEIGA